MVQQIAFLGTGIMGFGMARNLLKAGYRVTVYNRTGAKTEPLVAAGASRAASPEILDSMARLSPSAKRGLRGTNREPRALSGTSPAERA